MFKPTNKIHFFYFCVDLFLIASSFITPYLLRFNSPAIFSADFNAMIFPNLREYLLIFALWGVLTITSLQKKGLYSTDRSISIPKEAFLVITTIITTSIIVGTVIFFAKFIFFSRKIFAFNFILLIVQLSLWRIVKRLILRYLIKKGFHNYNVLIVGTNGLSRIIADEIRQRPFLGLKIIGTIGIPKEKEMIDLPVLGGLSEFEKICKKYFIEEVVVATDFREKIIGEIGGIAGRLNLGLRILPPDFEEAQSHLDISYLGFIPLLTYKERAIYPSELTLKRVFDFSVALILLAIFSPVFIIIAALVKLDGPGPVFYVQKRIGRKGRAFDFYKFRSMVRNADSLKSKLIEKNEVKDGVIFKIRRDPRITRVGKMLRRYSLDELPQLINVLKGDMSLVGPRPFPVDESKNLKYEQYSRLNIKPGITGLAQIKGRSDLTFNRWVKWDLWYINNWSFGLDINILLWTIPCVLKGRGAY